MGTSKIIPFCHSYNRGDSRYLHDKGGRRSGRDRRKKSADVVANDRRHGVERRSGRDRRCFRSFAARNLKEKRRVFLKTVLYPLPSKPGIR